MAQRVPTGQIAAHEGLVHEDLCGPARDLALFPGAPTLQRYLQRGEVFRTDEFQMGFLRLGGGLAQNFDGKDEATVRGSGVGRNARSKHARSCCNLLPESSEET